MSISFVSNICQAHDVHKISSQFVESKARNTEQLVKISQTVLIVFNLQSLPG